MYVVVFVPPEDVEDEDVKLVEPDEQWQMLLDGPFLGFEHLQESAAIGKTSDTDLRGYATREPEIIRQPARTCQRENPVRQTALATSRRNFAISFDRELTRNFW